MNFADAKEIEDEVKALRKTHWVLRLVTPGKSEYRQMSKTAPERLIFGAFKPDMLDGATVYAGGAVNPSSVNVLEVVAIPSPGWKGK